MRVFNAKIKRQIVCLTIILPFFVAGSLCFAQLDLPPVPTFTPQAPPMDAPNVSVNSPSPTAVAPSSSDASSLAKQNFAANFKKPFVGQSRGTWPPSFGTGSLPVVSPRPTPMAPPVNVPAQPPVSQQSYSSPELPPLPDDPPQVAQANPPVAQVPTVQVPGPGQRYPNANPYPNGNQYPNANQYPSAPAAPVNQYPNANAYPPQPPAVPQQAQYPPAAPQQPQNQIAPSAPAMPPVNQPPAPARQPAPQTAQYMFRGGSICPLNIRQARPGEHPLAPLVAWANEGIQTFNSKIKDYSYVMIKRERIDGQLQDTSTIFMKVREQPFSIYIKYLKPEKKAGVEALYRKGYHNDQLLGHDVGIKALAGSLWLDPNGRMAMAGQKYPITTGGIPNLVKKMLESVSLDMKNDPQGKETFVKFVEDGGNIDGRPCIRIDFLHPVQRPYFRFHRAEVYLDKEWGIPVRYAAWTWPTTKGGKLVLDEEFTFTKLKFNCGFTDWDFNEKNKEYKF